MFLVAFPRITMAFFGLFALVAAARMVPAVVEGAVLAGAGGGEIRALDMLRADIRASRIREAARAQDIITVAKGHGIYSSSTGLILISGVPFVAQAPLGEWENPVFQNACEEAAVLIVHQWRTGVPIAPTEAREQLLMMAEFERSFFGFHEDTSARDTARLMESYFSMKSELREGIAVDDILREVAKGNIVLVPVNGQKLKNPYFKPPGPIPHMIVVFGYDTVLDEFITHEPGTLSGAYFRYSRATIATALQDYPSGYHEPLEEGKTAMIVIPRYDNETHP